MNVLNIHNRILRANKKSVLDIFRTLSTEQDKIWPINEWPKMRFTNGVKIGSTGGHGPIRYRIVSYDPLESIIFQFQRPIGFNGIHKFEIIEIDASKTQIRHTIDIKTSFAGSIKWLFAIKWLHNALIEDAFDRIQNQIEHTQRKSKWSAWVKLLRVMIKTQRRILFN